MLNESALLSVEHLDILWAATEAEGTFDVVKSNVFAMIEELAGNLPQVGVYERVCWCVCMRVCAHACVCSAG